MSKHKLARSILCLGLTVLLLLLSQPLLAQTSLPPCTAEIADFDHDRTNDNDGAAGIIDIDKDGDGLIEICDLEGLNEMRYQLDGSGYKASADATKITHGCPPAGCRGYELVKDLDFNAAASYRTTSNQVTWTTGDGWSPIGSISNRFSSVFEGNGFMIAHLYINRSNASYVGLFSVSNHTAQIQNIRLSDVNISGWFYICSLVGDNHGIIINSNVTGTVNSRSSWVGGLVGSNRGTGEIISSFANVTVTQQADSIAGGLVGLNFGSITTSYATGMVAGNNNAGGLVGLNSDPTSLIFRSYATGMVTGNSNVGGLVGSNSGNVVAASYATGMVTGNSNVGGLVGSNSGIVTASYWDTQTSRQATSDGGTSKTTVELQSPTAPGTNPMEIYHSWSEDVWYFGGADDYPQLLFTVTDPDPDGDGVPNNDSAGNRVDIDQDGDGLIEIYNLEGLNEIRYQLDGSGYKAIADATKTTQGCPEAGCIGYELVKDLDFNTAASYRTASNQATWTMGDGWSPIGSDSNRFNSVFEGNGFTIAHLYINRGNDVNVGLFSVSDTAQIQNIRLSDMNVRGQASVGGLIGVNHGIIINSNVTGTVNSLSSAVGGLVGSNISSGEIISSFANVTVTQQIGNSAGGLVGNNVGLIRGSSASGQVAGDDSVGGLVGHVSGSIINSYATGSATGNDRIGGLAGYCVMDCVIVNTYAVGTVMGASEVGGLIGTTTTAAVITQSYWDTEASMHASRGNYEAEFAKTTAELQSPTAPGMTSMQVYYGWSEDIWDFGSNNTYPLLRLAVDSDGDLVNDAIDIDDDNDGLIEIHTIDDLHEIRFQQDGNAKRQHADDQKNTSGCPSWGCMGYELVRSLDFNDANSYRNYRINRDWTVEDYSDDSDHGWHPLPGFSAVFNGNGFIISNLQINRVNENNVGLFGVVHQLGRVENVELVYPNIRGGFNVGGLVGNNSGVVINSYVRDYDTDASTRDTSKYIEAISGSVGGLVGRNNGDGESIGALINSGAVIDVQIKQDTSAAGINANAGGLAGFNLNGAEIINSYARGTVKGPCGVGGLVANNLSSDSSDPEKNSKIINSYATGNVITGFGNCNDANNIRSGGLAAVNSGLISNSYTRSCFSSGSATVLNTRRGGVVQNNSGIISNSYYQTTGCGGLQQTPSGSNRTQQQLQTPTDASDLYSKWSVNEWDFGDNSQYPAIRYTRGSDKDNPGCGHRSLPDCDDLIKNQLPAGRSATDPASSAVSIGDIVTNITPVDDIDSSVLQPPEFNLLNSQYKLYVIDTRTDPTDPSDSMEIDLISGSNYSFSDCSTNITSLANGSGTISCTATTATVNFNQHHTITFNVRRASPDTKYGPFSIEVIPVAISPRRFTPSSILDEIIAVEHIGGFRLEPQAFNLSRNGGQTFYQLHVQDIRSNVDQQMHIRLMLASGNSFNECVTNIDSLPGGKGSISCPTNKEFNSQFNREHTIRFRLLDTLQYSIQIIPDIPLFSSVMVNSEVNGSPATFTDDGVMLVKLGDTVRLNAEDSLFVEGDISHPLNYSWRISSALTLFSGELRGESISFNINDGLFRNSQKGDAVLTLALRDKYNTATTLATEQIPIRILDRLVLTSGYGEVMRDQADKTLHRVVLAPDQPQTVITARSLNQAITLTVDDSAAEVSAENGDGTAVASNITVQLDEGSKTEFTITATDSDSNATTHTVQVSRRSGTVPIDNDDDDDGLIDIYTLDDLDEMRNQYANMPSTCGINSESECEGFELRRSLDFNAADSYQDNTTNTAWTTGNGWDAIFGFNRVFEGNGYTIANLYIVNKEFALQGLFSELSVDGVIKNVGLLDAYVEGLSNVGSLVGTNRGSIINSYVTTATIIIGTLDGGGLVGRNVGSIINSYAMSATVTAYNRSGGLVGRNEGSIISSFAYAGVIGNGEVGGLAGYNEGKIINTYAAGTVSSTQTVVSAGGLVGQSTSDSEIRNSYTISQVMPLTDGDSQVDGLVGDNDGSITASYWDKTVNADLTTSGDAKTTAELQNPTAPGLTSADTYYGWHTAAWDFGNGSHYPTLLYATTDNITVSVCADNPTPSSALPRCGSRIPNQAVRNLIPDLPDLPDLEVSGIMVSSQPVVNADGSINEGSNVRLMVNAIGESESYSYAWSQISGNALVLTTTDTATLNVAIPLDFVELDATTAAITFQVEVNDGSLTISRRAIITINQIDNGNPVTEVDVNAARLRVITTTADADGTDSFRYQWQQLVFGGAWTNIPAATTAAYWLPADVNARIQYRVEVTHTDSQGHTISYQQGPFRARFDDDNDGLIDIYTLEDLDAIRHQYSNMPNYCGSSGDIACNGFELRRNLDFNAAESYQSGMIDPDWTTSTGWLPIGLGNPTDFGSVFEGNGYTISGLHIDREQSHQGLFAELGADGEIKNVGLLDVAVRGHRVVGSLVGYSRGSIINSYATGEVSGSHRNIGGLVGNNGYAGSIRSSFAKVRVSGWFDVGGLVGFHVGRITNSYAAGTVEVTLVGNATVGGLVGEVGKNDGEIINSYAIGRIISNDNNAFAGGLVGDTTGTVIVSYWNTQTSGLQSSAGAATSRTTAQLQSPTAAGLTPMDTYYGWDDKVWDFGSNQDYPALRYVAGGLNACNADMSTASDLPQCGSLLANQERIGQVALAVSEVTVSSQPAANSDATINEGSNVRLMVNATGGSESYSYAWSQTSGNALELGSSDGATLDITIPSDFIAEDAPTTVLTFTVMVDDGMSTISRSKMITITKASLTISGVMLSAATIAEGSTATVTFDVSGGTGIYQYAYKLIAGEDQIALPSLTPPAVLVMPVDIVAAADSDRVVELNITVSDDGGRSVEHNEELTIQKVDNGLANIEASRATSTTLTVKVGSDPDGDATTPNYAYQWQLRAAGGAQWMNISGENDASYTITDNLAVDGNEFRVQVTYTDGQNYQETPTSNEIRYIPPSELPPLIVSNIELNVRPPANADGTINEGSKATLTFNVSGGTGDYQYASKIDDATYTSFELPFMYNIADDLVAADTTTQTVKLTIRISDQIDEIKDFEHIEELHILKTNKGSADININITSATLTVIIGTDPDGDPNPTSYIYQWQSKTGSEWMDIDDADDASYTISGDLASAGGEFRVQITYTDGQGYPETPTSNAIRYTSPDSSGLRIRTKVFLEGPLR